VLQRNCADRVDPASGRTSGADSWFAGPKADPVAGLAASELVEVGLVSLAEIFGLSPDRVRGDLVASLAIDWGNDTFAARRLFPRNAQNTRSAVGVGRGRMAAPSFPVRRFIPARIWALSRRR